MTEIRKYDSDYIEWLNELKNKIKSTQRKAAFQVNETIIKLYWEIGKELHEKQENLGWGNSVVDTLEKDLSTEFPDSKGFSRRNLFYMKGFYAFYWLEYEKVQQLVAQIPWGHNVLINFRNLQVNPFYQLVSTEKELSSPLQSKD